MMLHATMHLQGLSSPKRKLDLAILDGHTVSLLQIAGFGGTTRHETTRAWSKATQCLRIDIHPLYTDWARFAQETHVAPHAIDGLAANLCTRRRRAGWCLERRWSRMVDVSHCNKDSGCDGVTVLLPTQTD